MATRQIYYSEKSITEKNHKPTNQTTNQKHHHYHQKKQQNNNKKAPNNQTQQTLLNLCFEICQK